MRLGSRSCSNACFAQIFLPRMCDPGAIIADLLSATANRKKDELDFTISKSKSFAAISEPVSPLVISTEISWVASATQGKSGAELIPDLNSCTPAVKIKRAVSAAVTLNKAPLFRFISQTLLQNCNSRCCINYGTGILSLYSCFTKLLCSRYSGKSFID